LEERNRRIFGVLVDRKVHELTGAPILVVEEDVNKRQVELIVTETSTFNRRNSGSITWNDVRLGDSLDITTLYDRIVDCFATGTRTIQNVWITGIHISNTGFNYITALNEANEEVKFGVVRGSVDIYSLRVGSRIRAVLDSRELESFIVLSQASSVSVTGRVTSLSGSTLVIRENTAAATNHTFIFDSNTIIINAATGQQVTATSLNTTVNVHVVADTGMVNYARTITILN
jgi:hypothetical protein